MSRSILLTGFQPFGGEASNPSWEAVAALEGEGIAGAVVHAVELPVVFAASRQVLLRALDRFAPELVLCVGQAGGRSRLSLERVAINLCDARIPDNAGAQPIDQPVVAEGPTAYFSSLPIKAMAGAVLEAGIPAEISHTAGTYVCNAVFYALMHALALRPDVRGGFLHVPYSPAQAVRHPGMPSLPVELVSEGLRAALAAALATRKDLDVAGGSEH
jgi:pyroglutamyl-peptidase